jgi:hypothetical protein
VKHRFSHRALTRPVMASNIRSAGDTFQRSTPFSRGQSGTAAGNFEICFAARQVFIDIGRSGVKIA